MSLWNILFGGGGQAVATPVDAVGNALDKLFTSDEEKAQAALVMEKLRQQPGALQVELNKVEAAHASVFVAGWRPAMGWVAAIAMGFYYIPQAAVLSWMWTRQVVLDGKLVPFPLGAFDALWELVIAMLGLGAMRTVEKLTGKTK